MGHSKPVRLETAPTGGRKCLFIFNIYYNLPQGLERVQQKGLRLDFTHLFMQILLTEIG